MWITFRITNQNKSIFQKTIFDIKLIVTISDDTFNRSIDYNISTTRKSMSKLVDSSGGNIFDLAIKSLNYCRTIGKQDFNLIHVPLARFSPRLKRAIHWKTRSTKNFRESFGVREDRTEQNRTEINATRRWKFIKSADSGDDSGWRRHYRPVTRAILPVETRPTRIYLSRWTTVSLPPPSSNPFRARDCCLSFEFIK